MPQPIEYQKVMTEVVYINLPGPERPDPSMSGSEILHGFLAEFGRVNDRDIKAFVDEMCLKWNVHFKQAEDR